MARTTTQDAPEIELRKARGLWMMPLVRGLLLVVLGLLLMLQPLHTLSTLVTLFAVFLFLDGVVVLVQGLVNRDQTGWRWWLVQGAVDVVFAVMILVWPGTTALVLFYLLVVWTLVLGIVAIIGSVALIRNRDLGWPWLLTTGLLSTLFGFLLVTRSQDAAGALELIVVVFGIYAFVSGAVHIVSVFSMRSVAREIDRALAGQSLVVDAMAARQAAAREAAQARTEAKAAEKAEAKAAKEAEKAEAKAQKEADKAAAEQTKAAEKAAEKAAAEQQEEREKASGAVAGAAAAGAAGPAAAAHGADGATEPPAVDVAASGSTAATDERLFVDELAADTFPDAPGVVEPPHVLPFDQEIPSSDRHDSGKDA